MFKKIKDKIIGWLIIIGIFLVTILIVSMIVLGILNKMGFRFVIKL